jgi:hypothetical protein
MRPRWNFAPFLAAALVFAFLAPQSDATQAQPATQRPPAAGSPPAKAPQPPKPGPFKAVTITLPEPSKDPSFEAFRKGLVGIAQRKDRAALGRLIVSKGFFWEKESGNGADPKKSGLANFSASIGLDIPDDPDTGWDTIAIYAEDPTVFSLSDRPGVVCGPADPAFNEDEFQALLDTTKTDVSDWIYPVAPGVELRAAARPDAPVSDKVGLTFIRVLSSEAASSSDPAAADFLRVILPSGKIGFVKATDIASLGVSQICYVKEGDAWKIAGVIGGAE